MTLLLQIKILLLAMASTAGLYAIVDGGIDVSKFISSQSHQRPAAQLSQAPYRYRPF